MMASPNFKMSLFCNLNLQTKHIFFYKTKHLDQNNMTSRSYGTESWLAGAGTLEERTQFGIRHCVFKKLSYFCAWLEILVRISTKVMQRQVLNGWPLFWAYNLFLSRKIHLTGGDGLEDIALTVICVFMIYSNGTSIGVGVTSHGNFTSQTLVI